jgi:hypothetical protein
MDLAAQCQEAAPRNGARYPPTNHVDVEHPHGARHDGDGDDAKHACGDSRREERHIVEAGILGIGRRRENYVRRVSI